LGGYNALVDVGYARHFANRHINGIESFRAYAKLRLSVRKGSRKTLFYFHLKKTGRRFHHRRDNRYHVSLKLLREKPIYNA